MKTINERNVRIYIPDRKLKNLSKSELFDIVMEMAAEISSLGEALKNRGYDGFETDCRKILDEHAGHVLIQRDYMAMLVMKFGINSEKWPEDLDITNDDAEEFMFEEPLTRRSEDTGFNPYR